MAMNMRQQLKMTQQLVMTPQLQQAIKLLQMTRYELQDLVSQELEENPLLEEVAEGEDLLPEEAAAEQQAEAAQEEPAAAEESFNEVSMEDDQYQWDDYSDGYSYESTGQQADDEERPSFENLLTRPGTLADHLVWQLQMNHFAEDEVDIASEIIGNINEDGYLCVSIAEIAESSNKDAAFAEQVLEKVQDFDPAGVAARSLQECLLLQARSLGMQGSIVESILKDYLQELTSHNHNKIAKCLQIDTDQVLTAIQIIAGFDPYPGRIFGSGDTQYIAPDIFVHKSGNEYIVTLNDEGLPNLRISSFYTEKRKAGSFDAGADEYINDKRREAQWLIRSIRQRQQTILKVAKSIVGFQHNFMGFGVSELRPLVLRDVAEDVGMHESTISRVTTNKFMQTPQGLFELKFFFTSKLSTENGVDVASAAVKNRIKELIEQENPEKPLSDLKLSKILAEEKINIARRTVTKYREMMRIGSTAERKKRF